MPLLRAKSRVLVTLELPEPDELPDRMVELLSELRVLLLGWYEVPEQTSPEQAREEVEDVGEEALERAAERLREAGAEVSTRLVVTGDPVATVARIGAEEACDAALISRPLGSLERILLVLREEVPAGSVARLLSDLAGDAAERVTLLHISEEEAEEGRERSERVLEALEERGVDTDRVESRVETASEPDRAVLDACGEEDYDVVVIPERGELEDRLFGSFAEQVAARAEVPVLVVRAAEEGSEG